MSDQPSNAPSFGQNVVLAVSVSLVAIGLALTLYRASDVLMLAFAGVLLATVISAPAELLAARTRVPYTLALIIVLVAVSLLICAAGYFMGSRLVEQFNQLNEQMPHALVHVKADLEKTRWGHWVLEQTSSVRASIADLAQRPELLSSAGGVLSSTLGIVANIAVVIVFAVFIALTPDVYVTGVVTLFPPKNRPRVRVILGRVGHTLRWWFGGQLMSMATIALLTWIGLLFLGMPLGLTLAILAGLLNFIPNFGPILAAVPAVVIALSPTEHDAALHPKLALWVAALYLTVQILEGSLITPTIQRRAVSLPPALIVIGQVLLGLLIGPLGLVLATPILATVLVIVRMAYVEDVLGDKAAQEKS